VGASIGSSSLGRGFYYSILLMAGAPYLLAAGFGAGLYVRSRKIVRTREACIAESR
jgi:hypothetical protein